MNYDKIVFKSLFMCYRSGTVKVMGNLDVIYGQRDASGLHEEIENIIQETLSQESTSGTLYFGYPILIKSHNGEKIDIEALLITSKHGIIAFTMSNLPITEVMDAQDEIYNKLHSKFFEFKFLTKNRKLLPSLQVVTYTTSQANIFNIQDNELLIHDRNDLKTILDQTNSNSAENILLYDKVNSVIESLVSFKDRRARDAINVQSLGWAMNQVEKEIANLDRHQKKAALESSNGPQRIRGLAGSGKTIVLALKAAYLHVQNPEKQICITFNTRSLKDQFIDLVTRFTFEHIKDKPDWSKIEIIHAWGSNTAKGIYSQIAKTYQQPFYDFTSAVSKFGYDDAFSGSCNKLLEDVNECDNIKIYDIVLIDEAQDLPRSFFELIYKVTSEQKHIIWAYDELQTIGKYTIDTPDILFGNRKDGNPNISSNDIKNIPKQPMRDIVLKKCYRNPPWILSLAHSLGFGIYRDNGPIQAFDDPTFWKDIGYSVKKGNLQFGHNVTIERDQEFVPNFFKTHVDKVNSVKFKSFNNQIEQYEEVVRRIKINISVDEMRPRDILIIHANALTTKKDTTALRMMLSESGIDNHLAGVTSSVDDFFIDGQVTVSGIYRAKGNEAPIVYLVNSEYCFHSPSNDIVKKRNILFTAITRSRAHINIFGCGNNMESLNQEIQKVCDSNYELDFKYPTKETLAEMRVLYKGYKKQSIDTKNYLSQMLSSGDEADILKTLDDEQKKRLIALLEIK